MADTSTGSYAPFGTITVGPPTRPEKTAEQRQAEALANRITQNEMLRDLGWTLADLERAGKYGFTKDVTARPGAANWRGQREIYYHRDELAAWLDGLRRLATKV